MIKWLKKLFPPRYSREEAAAVEAHIEKYFGECDAVLHEPFATGVRADVYALPPSPRRNFSSLVTCGMGALKMKVPAGKGLEEYARAELIICLPRDWNFKSTDEKWSWPVLAVKTLTHLPVDKDSWLGYGHTVDFGHAMSMENTQCGALITMAFGEKGCEVCSLPGGGKVWFYQVIPVYREEIQFKEKYGTSRLIDRLQKVTGVVIHQERHNVGLGNPDVLPVIMDRGAEHCQKVPELKLPLEEIAGYQHLAIYLMWAMKHDLMGEEFLKEHGDVAAAVRENRYEGDLRAFIRDALRGDLRADMFSRQGGDFALWYYGEDVDEDHYYPSDVDRYALQHFGEARYNCDAFKTEGYLFVPWNEAYIQGLSAVIERQFEKWQNLAAV